MIWIPAYVPMSRYMSLWVPIHLGSLRRQCRRQISHRLTPSDGKSLHPVHDGEAGTHRHTVPVFLREMPFPGPPELRMLRRLVSARTSLVGSSVAARVYPMPLDCVSNFDPNVFRSPVLFLRLFYA